jgi:hypothetical protein
MRTFAEEYERLSGKRLERRVGELLRNATP